jgi:8-oxo-dGTP pyrophosphatase MutT (NUDIX family)
MPNPIKIYFPNGYLFLTETLPSGTEGNLKVQTDVFLENPTEVQLLEHIEELLNGGALKNVNILTDQPQNSFNFIASRFKVIEAAGGIVVNDNKEMLFIFRRGKWDLPKGKMDENESPENAALREIEEETGAKGLSLLTKLGETYHVYNMYGENVLKTTHWYLLKSTTNQVLSPQLEEDITAIKWFRKEDLNEPLTNSYPTIIDLVNIYLYREANKL